MKKTLTILSALAASSLAATAATVMNYDFNDVNTGTVKDNTAQFDYTRGVAYEAGTNTGANTLAFSGGSSGTDYSIRNKGTGHEKALFINTINSAGPNSGIYFQKIDMTAGGANATQVVRVSWSFDILGYDQNGGIDPTGWNVNIRFDNASPNLGASDAWYSTATTTAVNAQSFSFSDDSTCLLYTSDAADE